MASSDSIPLSVTARFWKHVRKSEGCWEWTGSQGRRGYGHFAYAGKCLRAHRVSWSLVNGPIPGGRVICHRCDNPRCVRPSHLFVGTTTDNMRDASRKGRLFGQRPGDSDRIACGEHHHRAILTERSVREIRSRAAAGESVQGLATEFGVSRATASRVVSLQTWKHVVTNDPIPVFKNVRGTKHGMSKLSDVQVLEIRALNGVESHRAIAARFGISHVQVGRLQRGVSWSHL